MREGGPRGWRGLRGQAGRGCRLGVVACVVVLQWGGGDQEGRLLLASFSVHVLSLSVCI